MAYMGLHKAPMTGWDIDPMLLHSGLRRFGCSPFSKGKIGVFVPQLCLEGQVRPSTFRYVNLVPELLFLGQTHPYADVVLHINMMLMRKVISTPLLRPICSFCCRCLR